MDKKILDRPAYNLDNKVLETAIVDYTTSKNDVKKLQELLELFGKSQVLVPVAFPKKVNPRLLAKMLRGEPLKKNENFPLFPVTMTDQQGNKFAPAFTSREKVLETKDFPYMIRVPAGQVIANVKNEKAGLEGVLINPMTGGFVIKRQAFLTDFSKIQAQGNTQVKKVSKAEFDVLARNSVEKNLIPKQLFEEKSKLVHQIEEQGGGLLRELYGKPYGDKLPNPYQAEDFSVMSLAISEETTAVCVELPKKNVVPHIALSAYIVLNPKTDEVYYYMIEKGEAGQNDVLCNITPDGKHQELMTAPPVGSELTAVLDLIREEQEETE